MRFCVLVFALTRVPVLVAIIGVKIANPRRTLAVISSQWDGWWYVQLASRGYSTSLRPPLTRVTDWHHQYSDWAFFPGYPLAIRVVHDLTRVPFAAVAISLSVIFGVLALRAVHLLGTVHAGPDVGRAAAVLFAVWPGAAVLGQPYSEGLFTAAAAGCLAMLISRRWVLAGVLGAVASATRPTGVAVVVACAVVAVVELVRRQGWRAMLAPLLAVGGVAGFVLFGWWRTGDPLVWRHAENLWSQKFDLNHAMVLGWWHTLGNPAHAIGTSSGRQVLAASLLEIGGALALGAFAVALWRHRRHLGRLRLPLVAYTAVALVTILGYSAVGPRPRTLLALIPVAVWVGDWWPPRTTRRVAIALTPVLGVITLLWLWRVTP
jgi:hypothetical protein